MTVSGADELRAMVRDYLTSASPSARVRELMATDAGHDPVSWTQMANQLGLHGVAVPEQYGGAGAGLPELAVVFEEMGAALLCAPFLATVGLAIPALLNSGDTAAMAECIPSLVDGSTIGTVVLNGALEAWDPDAVTLTARRDGAAFRVSGSAGLVLDGMIADIVLVAARTERGMSLFLIDAEADGLVREPLATLDRTRKVACLRFDEVPARLIGDEGNAAEGLARTSHVALTALAAEQVGGAQRCLDLAVDYAKERIQFGRAIGSFQAVKHRCADMLVLVEGARSAAVHAAEVSDDRERAIAASVAKMACSEAYLHVALDCMRVHGGIGFTWEHDAHLYVRRAKATALMFGSPDHHALRLASLITAPRHQLEGRP
jgi:alkylation response protein AidB-like acyl-CoA dehydrogenase